MNLGNERIRVLRIRRTVKKENRVRDLKKEGTTSVVLEVFISGKVEAVKQDGFQDDYQKINNVSVLQVQGNVEISIDRNFINDNRTTDEVSAV